VIPYIELFILIHMHKGKDTLQQWESTADHYLPVQLGPFFVRFGVPVFLLGVVLGILRETSIEYVQPMSNFNLLTIVFLTACIATAFIVIMYITFGNNGKWNSLFKLLLPFVAIAVFCIPLAEHEALTWTMLLVITGYMLFEALMWIFFGQIAQQFNLSPVLTYGVGRGLLALASLLGTLIAMFDTYAAWELRSDMKMSFMLVILIVAFAILPERRDIMSIRKNAAKLQRIASERNDDFAPDVEDADEEPWAASAAPGCGVADAGAGVGAGVGAGAQGGEGPVGSVGVNCRLSAIPEAKPSGVAENKAGIWYAEGVTGAPAVAATVTDDEGATGNVTACEKSARCAGAPEAAAGAAHTNAAGEVMLGQRLPATPGAAPEVMLGGAPSVGGAGVAGATGAPSATQTDTAGATASAEPAPKVYSIGATTSVIQPGASGPMAAVAEPAADAAHADEFDMARFRAQLDAVANTYLLSRREADVLLYLARGYKAAYIQEKLYIAEGTAKTHIRHIYRKLNVHSQQELMRLVDTTEI
jgi:DNA-binding CsgD family transcriptional regulator